MSPETGHKVHAIVTEGSDDRLALSRQARPSRFLDAYPPAMEPSIRGTGVYRGNHPGIFMHRPLFKLAPATLLSVSAIGGQAAEPSDPPTKELDTVVVTAARTPTPLNQIGSNVTVVTAEEIAMRQFNDVADVLRYVPGLDVLRNGGIGQTASVFMRGADSRFTLVLIDGIEANDPANPGGQFDFANLMVDEIERIEVVRGGESSIYGSDAIGGVINIITKRGRGTPKVNFQAQGGSYDQYDVRGNSEGAAGPVNYNLSVGQFGNLGFSAAARDLGNFERDGYRNTTVKAGLSAQALDNLNLDWTLHYNHGHDRLDNCGGRGCDDPNFRSNTDQLFTRGQGTLSLLDGAWQQSLGVAYSFTGRQAVNPLDTANPFISDSNFDGRKIKASWLHDLTLFDQHKLTIGGEDEEDSMSSDFAFFQDAATTTQDIQDRRMNTAGVFLQDRFTVQKGWFSTVGVRYDDNNISGSKVTWRTSQSLAVDRIGLRIKGNYGTGFKVPTLFQLFAPETVFTVQGQEPIIFPALGNRNLSPESSRNWDIGFEQALWDNRVQFGASYFHNDFFHLIEVRDFSKGFQNIARAKSDGVEVFMQMQPHEMVMLKGQYTYLDTEQLPEAGDTASDIFAGQPLLRRPRNKGSFDVIVNPFDNAEIDLNVLAVGRKDDVDFALFPAQRVTIPGYVLVNLNTHYTVNKNIQLFARLNNLLNKSYQEVFGYGTAGIALFGGFQLRY